MRIVVGVLPLAGHVGPFSGLVAALVERGHEVVVHTGTRYGRRFADLGAEPVAWSSARDFDETDIAAAFPRAARPGPLGPAAFAEDAMVRTAAGQVADLLPVLDRRPVDLLIGDVFAVGIGLAAELRSIPWASVSALPPNFLSEELPPPGMIVAPARGPIGRHRDRMLRRAFRLATSGMDRAYRSARREVGLPIESSHSLMSLFSAQLVLATGAPSMELPRHDLPPAVHFIGRLPPAVPTVAGDQITPAGRPVVLVTQGTHNLDPRDLLEPAALGLADFDADVVVTTGRRGVRRLSRSVPPSVRVVDFLDFTQALPQLTAMVSNGGWGTLLEAAGHGVPVAVAGGDIDKPENAVRIARAGAGINLKTKRPRPQSVADAVAKLITEPTWRSGARRLGDELRELGGIERSVSLLEQLADTGRPIRRSTDPWTGRPESFSERERPPASGPLRPPAARPRRASGRRDR